MMKTKLPYALIFLSGLLLGWLALGWWLWPVAYVGDAYTYELNQADKLTYTSAVVDSFVLTGQVNPAWFAQWTPAEVNQALEQVIQHNPAKANWARALANQANVSITHPAQVKAQAQASEGIPADWVLPCVAVMVVVGGVVGLVIWARGKRKVERFVDADDSPRYVEQQETHFTPLHRSSASLAQAQLTFGPDQPADQHFPIESGGAHLGEFGVSQVEGLQAWDVWLFDPKALATVTKVLSDEMGSALDGRGEYLAWKEPFSLETTNLKMSGTAAKLLEGGIKVELSVEGKDETE